MNGDIARLPKIPTARLVNHDAAMRQAEALLGCPSTQQQGAHGGGLSHTRRADWRGDIRHGVVDGKTSGHAATGRVDVELDRFFRRVGFKEEQLCDNGSGGGFVNLAIEADDSFLTFRQWVGLQLEQGLIDIGGFTINSRENMSSWDRYLSAEISSWGQIFVRVRQPPP